MSLITPELQTAIRQGEITKHESESKRVSILKLSLDDRLKNELNNPLEPITKQDLFVKAFGYEIEGGFDSSFEDFDYWKCDGSVSADGLEGEIASPIFQVYERESFYKFAKLYMPDDVNSTCGHHVHISFNNLLAYQKCMERKYYDQFLIQVNRFFKNTFKDDKELLSRFKKRFKGDISYCRKAFTPQSQTNNGWYLLDGQSQGRYTMLNYPFSEHQTIECRLFPSTTSARKMVLMIEWFVRFTNSYLKTCSINERGINDKLVVKLTKPYTKNEVFETCV